MPDPASGLLWAEDVAEAAGIKPGYPPAVRGQRVRSLASQSKNRLAARRKARRKGDPPAALDPWEMPLPVAKAKRSYPGGGTVVSPQWDPEEVAVYAAARRRRAPQDRPQERAS